MKLTSSEKQLIIEALELAENDLLDRLYHSDAEDMYSRSDLLYFHDQAEKMYDLRVKLLKS